MPGYKTHDISGSIVTTVVATTTYFYSLAAPLDIAVFIVGGLVGTFLLSPDLDTHSRIYNRWGIFRIIWEPYRRVVKHRSIWSHSGPLSATLRLLYLALFLFPAILLLSIPPLPILFFWIGVVIADITHVVLDIIVSGVKYERR